MALRVVLVDDHRLMREGLKSFLSQRGVDVVGEGSNGREGVRLARELRPDVVLMDLGMPEMSGLEATRMIQAERQEQVVVILTASEDEANLFEAVKAGARGYLLKSIDPEQLVGQLDAAARGEAALTPALAAKILHELARTATTGSVTSTVQGDSSPGAAALPSGHTLSAPRPGPDDAEPLTARERDVLDLVVSGASNRQIAEALVVSDNTVKYHLKNILQKLHVRNRAQVVAYALRQGLDKPAGEP